MRCSNSVKSSTERSERFEPWICWLNRPRRLVVSSRKRAACGRTSGVRWKAALVWKFEWQSRHVDAEARLGDLAVLGLVELLLRERRQQQPQSLHLHRRDDAVHQLVEVLDRQQLAARHVAQLRLCREKDRRRKLRREVIRKIEVHVEAPQVASLLAADRLDLPIGKNLSAGRLLDVRQRQKAGRKQTPLSDVRRSIWARASQVAPCGSFTRTPPCTGFRPALMITPEAGRFDKS